MDSSNKSPSESISTASSTSSASPKSAANLLNSYHSNRIDNCLSQDLSNLLTSANMSDVCLVAGKKEFPCHKLILSARSPVFAAMFAHDTTEANQGRVDITDIEPEVCEQMLKYIYSGKHFDLEPYAQELFIAADKYGLDQLKEVCENWLRLSLTVENAVEILELSDMHNANQLKTATITFITSPRNSQQLVTTKAFKELFTKRPTLAYELYADLSARNRIVPPAPSHFTSINPNAFIVHALNQAPIQTERGPNGNQRIMPSPRRLRRMMQQFNNVDGSDFE